MNAPLEVRPPTWAFILYDSRSGSTLLASLLDRYQGVAVTPENAVVSHVLDRPALYSSRASLAAGFDLLWRDPIVAEMAGERAPMEAAVRERLGAGAVDPIAFLDAFYSAYFERIGRSGARLWIIKHPPYRHLDALLRDPRDVRFVHIVRDGRDVFSSKLSNTNVYGLPMERSVRKAALDWRRKVEIADDLGPACHTVRYEKLVEAPERELEAILRFLGFAEPPAEREGGGESFSDRIGARQRHLHARVGANVDSRAQSRWKRSLAPWQVQAYEALAGSTLTAMGYEPSPHTGGDTWARGRAVVEYAWVRISNAARTAMARDRRLFRVPERVGWLGRLRKPATKRDSR